MEKLKKLSSNVIFRGLIFSIAIKEARSISSYQGLDYILTIYHAV